jgi:hypothetical protein
MLLRRRIAAMGAQQQQGPQQHLRSDLDGALLLLCVL